MASIFSKIIAGDIPASFVHMDEHCVVFLDVNPQTLGHVLVVPRQEIGHWIDLPESLATHLFQVAQRVGQAQKSVYDCERVGLMIQGYEVDHTHIHVWPTNSLKDFSRSNATTQPGREDLEAEAEKLRAALA